MSLSEIVSEIERVIYFREGLAIDEVCSEKTRVNAEKYVPKSPWKIQVLEK